MVAPTPPKQIPIKTSSLFVVKAAHIMVSLKVPKLHQAVLTHWILLSYDSRCWFFIVFGDHLPIYVPTRSYVQPWSDSLSVFHNSYSRTKKKSIISFIVNFLIIFETLTWKYGMKVLPCCCCKSTNTPYLYGVHWKIKSNPSLKKNSNMHEYA